MRINVVMLISGLDEEALERRRESLTSLASPGTRVRLLLTENAPPSVESFAETEMAAPGILKRVVRSERDWRSSSWAWVYRKARGASPTSQRN